MGTKILGWMMYFAVVAGAVAIGWNEPLKYRFMSRAEIDELEHPTPPPTPPPIAVAKPTPGAWMYDGSRKTGLDRDSFNNYQSSVPRPAFTPYPNQSTGR